MKRKAQTRETREIPGLQKSGAHNLKSEHESPGRVA